MAGKKVDGGEVKVTLTDGGSLKDLEKKAKKTGKQMGSVAKNVNESDRRLKSLSQQTSNSTKAFSKQAQTIGGGLVPIYATIAAQVFAVSAAFRFLQDAMETRNMIEGQKTFGAVTGQAFATMTASVQAATANMITFKEAASAVAIGTAAGLTRGQLEGLGKAAKDASLALGRDVTDSFNRLIRGVTKAEPELLDELGIILRLEPATEKYALSIGKARTELNAFERSQAVANEVLDQAERKFGMIAKIMDPDAFALGQFAKEFDDLMKEIKVKVVEVVIPVVQFLKDNILSLVGVFGLLAAPIVSQLLPDFGKFAEGASRAADASKDMAKGLRADAKLIDKIKSGGDIGKQGRKEFSKRGTSGLQSMLAGQDMSGQSKTMQKAAMGKKLNAQELGVLKRHLKQKGHMINQYNAQDRAKFLRHIRQQELSLKGSLTKAKLEYKQLGITSNAVFAQMKAVATSAFGAVARGAAFATKMVSRLMGAFGWISLAFIAFDALKNLFGKKSQEEATKLQQKMDELKGTMEDLNEELERMERVRSLGLLSSSIEMVIQSANSLKSSDVAKIIRDYNSAVTSGASEEVLNSFRSTAATLVRLSPEMKGFTDLFDGSIIQASSASGFMEIANGIMATGQALGMMAEQLQNVSQAMTNLINSAPKSRFAKLQKSIQDIRGESGAFGAQAFEKRRDENARFTEIIADKSNYLGIARSGADMQTQLQTAGGKPSKEFGLPEQEALLQQVLALAGTAEGAQVLEEGTGVKFAGKRGLENYFEGLKTGTRADFDILNEALAPFISAIASQGLDDPKAFKAFVDDIQQIQDNQDLDLKDIKKDEKTSTILEGIEKDIGKNIAEENRLRTDNNRLKLEGLKISMKINPAERKALELMNQIELKTNAVATAQNNYNAAKLINSQEYADANSIDKAALEEQQKAALENLEIAKQELAVIKEKVNEQRKLQEFQLQRSFDTLATGSFVNSFANKQRDNVFKNESDIRLAGIEAGMGIDDPVEKEKAMNAAILERTQYYMDQAIEIEKVNGMLKLQEGISKRLTEGLANDFAGALVDVAKGTKTAKEAFGEMAVSIIADITKMIIKQMILAAIMAVTGMANPGAAASLGSLMGMTQTPARQGGIMSPGAGGGYRSYRAGGIADGPEKGYPATLHGTEAVVPLGNDREIPVKMLEGGGGTNNVAVTVNMSEGGTDFKMEGEKAKTFAHSIAAAVQQEIVKQKRTGGLLNEY